MRYLFFDVECSNCFNNIGKICEVGYIITDDNFNILQQKDILLNPGNKKEDRFCLINRKKQNRDIHLAHEENDYLAYKEAPFYDDYYENLKYLFTQNDITIFGFSCIHDMVYILQNNERSGNEIFQFDSVDIQKILSIYNYGTSKKQEGLEKTFKAMFPQNNRLIAHRPDCDAIMRMMILKKICEDLEMNIHTIIHEYPQCIITHAEAVHKRKIIKSKRIVPKS